MLIDYSNYDIRLLINLLQELYNINPKININSVKKLKKIFSKKNKLYNNDNSIVDLLTKKLDIEESYNIYYSNYNMIPYYIYDNLILFIKNLKISESEKILLYNKLLKCPIDYDFCYNRSDSHFWDYNQYLSIFCSYELNTLVNSVSKSVSNSVSVSNIIKKDITPYIKYPKIYTVVPNKANNNKFTPFNFYNFTLINLIYYHLFFQNGNKKKLKEYLKKYNIKNIDDIIKYKKYYINFEKNQLIK